MLRTSGYTILRVAIIVLMIGCDNSKGVNSKGVESKDVEIPGYGVANRIDEVIAFWGQPDYTDRGLEVTPKRRWVNYAGYRYRGLVLTYLDDGKIVEVDIKERATAPEDADVRPKPKRKIDDPTSIKREVIRDYGLRCVTADGEVIDIKFGTHRDAVREEFGFPDKREVIDNATYTETTIHESYNSIGVTFIYSFADKRMKEFSILTP